MWTHVWNFKAKIHDGSHRSNKVRKVAQVSSEESILFREKRFLPTYDYFRLRLTYFPLKILSPRKKYTTTTMLPQCTQRGINNYVSHIHVRKHGGTWHVVFWPQPLP